MGGGNYIYYNCQLRYANRHWGKELTDKGKEWLKNRGMQQPTCPPPPPVPSMPFSQAAQGMAPTMPFPQAWPPLPSIAGMGVTIPPRFPIQLDTSGRMESPKTPTAGGSMGAMEGFQFGMQMATLASHCQDMQRRLDYMQAAQMNNSSSEPSCDSDTGTLFNRRASSNMRASLIVVHTYRYTYRKGAKTNIGEPP